MSVRRKRNPITNAFPLPHEVFELGLERGPLLVYICLVYHESTKLRVDDVSCAAIGKAVGLCEKTVRTHLRTLATRGFIQLANNGDGFPCALCPIRDKMREYHSADSPSPHKGRWSSMKQEWITGEVFDAVFPLPDDVFRLGLKPGELLVYIYLQYQKGLRNGQCWPSYSTIGAAVGMSRKTVRKHVCALVDKGLVKTENTTVRWKDGRVCNGNLRYTLKPITQVMRERERERLAELKVTTAQRKWAKKIVVMMPTPDTAHGKSYPALNSRDIPGTAVTMTERTAPTRHKQICSSKVRST